MLLPGVEDFFTFLFFCCTAFGRHYGDTNRVQHVWLQGKNVTYHAAAFYNQLLYHFKYLSSFRICDVGLPVEGEIPDEGVPLTNCHDVQDCDQPSALTKLPARVPDR
jgi:hypothetical protein